MNKPGLQAADLSGKRKHPSDYGFSTGEILLFNKPISWTSFDVVNKIRYLLGVKKVGHAGTLDPLAEGLLILATGKATKAIEHFSGQNKVYEGSLKLGATTPSYDGETEITQHWNLEEISAKVNAEDIQQQMLNLSGQITQLPPAFSAVKVKGVPMYKLARKGKQVEKRPREVSVYEFKLLKFEDDQVDFRVHCSKGTYIRSLVHDLGQALGCGAWMNRLVRTQIGDFLLEDAWNLQEFVDCFADYKQKNQEAEAKLKEAEKSNNKNKGDAGTSK
jgi:tRNA pseudouridine55 synthase